MTARNSVNQLPGVMAALDGLIRTEPSSQFRDNPFLNPALFLNF